MNNPTHLVLHTLAFQGTAGVDDVDRWHRERGFNRVGYHYIIRKDGSLETGRLEHETGAHCLDGGYNRKSIGIAFEGHGNIDPWTDEQWLTFRKMYLFFNLKYGMTHDKVIGHREAPAVKDCPGTLVDMDQVRLAMKHATYINFTL